MRPDFGQGVIALRGVAPLAEMPLTQRAVVRGLRVVLAFVGLAHAERDAARQRAAELG